MDTPGKNTGVGCRSHLQKIFQTQGSNLGLLHAGEFFTVSANRKDHKGYCSSKEKALDTVACTETNFSRLLATLSQKVKVKSLSHAQLFVTPWIVACTKLLRPWDFQGKVLEWVAISFSRESSRPRDRTQVSHIVDRCYHLSHQGSPPVPKYGPTSALVKPPPS